MIANLQYGTAWAQASVTRCTGAGLITSVDVQYGTCATDANSGTASVEFSNHGSTATLGATLAETSQPGSAEQVATFWENNAPLDGSSEICVQMSVTRVSSTSAGAVDEDFGVYWNYAEQRHLIAPVTATGKQTYCEAVPAGVANVGWQLITLASANSPGSKAHMSETIAVTIS